MLFWCQWYTRLPFIPHPQQNFSLVLQKQPLPQIRGESSISRGLSHLAVEVLLPRRHLVLPFHPPFIPTAGPPASARSAAPLPAGGGAIQSLVAGQKRHLDRSRIGKRRLSSGRSGSRYKRRGLLIFKLQIVVTKSFFFLLNKFTQRKRNRKRR